MIEESSASFYIKKSTIPKAGKGLFARRAIALGEMWQVHGVTVPRNSPTNECTRYADAYKFRIRNHLLIPTGYSALINHSFKPNLKKVVKGRKLFLSALDPIRPGQELFFCYHTYAQKRFFE
jgi:SET domain-containing protein